MSVAIIIILNSLVKPVQFSFSRESGFYDEAFELKIIAPTNDIYYTLDGSEPDRLNGNKYDGAIQISELKDVPNKYANIEDVCPEFLDDNYLSYQTMELMGYQLPLEPVDKCTIIRAVYYDRGG